MALWRLPTRLPAELRRHSRGLDEPADAGVTVNAPVTEHERLARLARRAGDELDGAPALDILGWAVAQFGASWCVTSSMADAVLPHLASRVMPGLDVVFLDTGYHFAETIGTRNALAAT